MVNFYDVIRLVKRKFDLKGEDGKIIRFYDADNLKTITKSDYVIFEKQVSSDVDQGK